LEELSFILELVC